MADQGDTGDADQLASRIDVGDPDPKKEILRFLRVPYLLSEHVLKLARENQVFHVLGVVIARQALRLVLLLNAEVSRDGPNRAQLSERVKLQDQIVGLEAVLRGQGSYSVGQVTQPDLDQVAYQQYSSQIKQQYDLFFPPSPAREENFNLLLNYDKTARVYPLPAPLSRQASIMPPSTTRDLAPPLPDVASGERKRRSSPLPTPSSNDSAPGSSVLHGNTTLETSYPYHERRISHAETYSSSSFTEQPVSFDKYDLEEYENLDEVESLSRDSLSIISAPSLDYSTRSPVPGYQTMRHEPANTQHLATTPSVTSSVAPASTQLYALPAPSLNYSTTPPVPISQKKRGEPTNIQRLAILIQRNNYQPFCSWTPSSCSINGKLWHQAAFSYAGYTVLPPTGGWHETAAAAREETAFHALPRLIAHLGAARR